MARILLEAVTKRFGGANVVDGINLEINDGEFLVLVGPSGCGKTTTLRMIAGLETISSGTVTIGERVVNDVQPKDRDIGMVFQNYALYPHMSIYENMSFGLRLHHIAADEIKRRIAATAELLGLSAVLERKPKHLSGGQRQRVALGRAIVREPAVFLMDEPLSNLDAKLRVQTRTEILRLHQRLKSTFVYVTHDQVEAMTMADRIVIMKDGLVQQFASPREVYERPANTFVAGFMGSPQMNLIPVRIEQVEGRIVAVHGDARIELGLDSQVTGEVTLGMRPENLVLGPAGEAGTLTLTVDVVETLGAEQHLYLTLPDGSAFTARADGDASFRPGEKLGARPHNGHVHLFDRASGERLAQDLTPRAEVTR